MDRDQLLALERRASEQCAAARTGRGLPPHPFTTDACSAWPDGTWIGCCVEHDIAYWCGGPAAARASADDALQRCVAESGYPKTGALMHLGVRLGGAPWLPFPWRWGYGFDWPYRYDD